MNFMSRVRSNGKLKERKLTYSFVERLSVGVGLFRCKQTGMTVVRKIKVSAPTVRHNKLGQAVSDHMNKLVKEFYGVE